VPALVSATVSALEMVRRRKDGVAKFIEVKVGFGFYLILLFRHHDLRLFKNSRNPFVGLDGHEIAIGPKERR
jgi:hypothetical protein